MKDLISRVLRYRVGRWAAVVCVAAFVASAASCRAQEPLEKRVQELVRLLGSENFDEREKAAKQLVEIGAQALEPLKKAAGSTDLEIAGRAKECIRRIDRNAKVAIWLIKLRSEKEEEREEAGTGLYNLGPEVADFLPAVVETLDHPNVRVRQEAVGVLTTAGPNAQVALPKLLAILKDKRQGTVDLRRGVMACLERMGPAARQGVPILLQILETEDPYIRSFAAQTLTKVGKDDPRVVPALLRAFAQDDIEIRCIGAGALACLKQESATVVPGIVQVLKTYPFKTEKELRLKHGFIRVLNEYGPLAEPALPYLIQLAQDYGEDPSSDRLVKDALISIGPAAHKAIPGLKELGENPRDFDFYTLIKKLKQN